MLAVSVVVASAARPTSSNAISHVKVGENGLLCLDLTQYDTPGGLVSEPDKIGQRPKVSVVIPAMNEARNIGSVLRSMPPDVDEVVLVDGSSVDRTVEVARAAWPGLILVNQARKGKGNALAAGFEACTGHYIVMLDADGSMSPTEINSFVSALDAGAHYAKGSRFAAGGGSSDITGLRRLGNFGLNALTNLLFRTRYSDLCYGYNAFRRECLAIFQLESPRTPGPSRWGDGFEIETILNIRVARARALVTEVPSFERDRLHGQSNLRTFRDGFRVLCTIVRERLHRRPPDMDDELLMLEAAETTTVEATT